MSALAGRWNFDGQPAGAACARMLKAQQLYGPHDIRQSDEDAVAMGRCLYRTLPEDVFDRQPLIGGGGRWRLVTDVRLDNRGELAGTLGIQAGQAREMSDADVLLRAWERWETEVFDRLLGDYAFAIWDARDRRLVLARDALGVRPLHYHVGAGFAAFASMPKGLHALADVPYAPDQERIAELLVLMPEYGQRSFFEGVSRVEAGQVVTITPRGVATRLHWQPEPTVHRRADASDFAEGLRAELDRAVAARLRGSGGLVGSHLSGGLDSAAVTATAARVGAGRILAFTSVPRLGYDGPDPKNRIGDEGPLAAATAALYPNIEHVLVRPDGRGLLDDFDRNFHLFERPILNACNQQWLTAINAAARTRGVTVMLTGAMGNMSISYAGSEFLAELAGTGRWLRLARELRGLVKSGQYRWRGGLAASFGPWVPQRLWRGLNRAVGRSPPAFTDYSALRPLRFGTRDLQARASAHGLDPSRPRRNAFDTRLWALRRSDPGSYGKGVLGGWGVDLRDPTADRRLIEYCLSLPMEAYLAGGHVRRLIKYALADRLPPIVIDESRKGLQAADWHEALTAARHDIQVELSRCARVPAVRDTLDLDRLANLVAKWPEAGWYRSETSDAYRFALLRGTVTGHFLRMAARSNA